jgi:hypothetical protein
MDTAATASPLQSGVEAVMRTAGAQAFAAAPHPKPHPSPHPQPHPRPTSRPHPRPHPKPHHPQRPTSGQKPLGSPVGSKPKPTKQKPVKKPVRKPMKNFPRKPSGRKPVKKPAKPTGHLPGATAPPTATTSSPHPDATRPGLSQEPPAPPPPDSTLKPSGLYNGSPTSAGCQSGPAEHHRPILRFRLCARLAGPTPDSGAVLVEGRCSACQSVRSTA